MIERNFLFCILFFFNRLFRVLVCNKYCIRWQDMFNRIFTICCSTLNYTFCLCSLRSCRMQNLPLHLVLLLFDSAFESRLTGTRSFSLTALPIIAAHEIKCDSNHLKITSILEKKKKRCNGTPFCKNESKEWAKTIKN